MVSKPVRDAFRYCYETGLDQGFDNHLYPGVQLAYEAITEGAVDVQPASVIKTYLTENGVVPLYASTTYTYRYQLLGKDAQRHYRASYFIINDSEGVTVKVVNFESRTGSVNDPMWFHVGKRPITDQEIVMELEDPW